MKSMSATAKITFSAIISALSIATMFASSIVPTATIAIPAIAGCFLIAVVFECGVSFGFLSYFVVSGLSFFLIPSKEAFLIYLLFFGYYPVLYAVLEKIKSTPFKILVKLIIFNFSVLLDFILVSFFFGIPFETIEFLGYLTPYALLLAANIVLFLFDYSLKSVINLYYIKIHPLTKKLIK